MAKRKEVVPWDGLPDGFEPKANQFGFVYILECEDEGKHKGVKYIGSKRFWSMRAGKKSESDWRKYQSSSTTAKSWKKVKKTVLHIAASKFELEYLEILYIMEREALLRDDFCNYMLGRITIGRRPAYMAIK